MIEWCEIKKIVVKIWFEKKEIMTHKETNDTTKLLSMRASELQRKIQQQLKTLQEEQQQRQLSSTKVIMDEKGNLVDANGNIIQLNKRPVASTLINRKKQSEERHQSFKFEKPPDIRKSEFYDRSIGDIDQHKKKRKRALNFHQKGTFIQEAKKLRSLKEEDQKQQEETDTEQLLKQIHTTPAVKKEEQDKSTIETGEINLLYGHVDIRNNVPVEVEWWDTFILNEKNYDNLETNLKKKLVDNSYIEHPLPIPPAIHMTEGGPIPLMLTAKERRKIRTQARMQREKEIQQKIRLGLIPPPPPKANLKNFMRVHLNDGTQDPTRLEKQIRREIEQRKQNHEARNQARKLTKQQKKKKKKQKIQEDESKELQVALFRVADLSHPANRFKVNVKAQELGITGCVITCGGYQGNANSTLRNKESMILIIAEGGPKAIRKYKNTIVGTIDWSRKLSADGKEEEDENSDEDDREARNRHKAALIWQGVLKERGFKTFKFQNFPDDETAHKYLKDLGLESYYNMASTWAGEAEIVEEEV